MKKYTLDELVEFCKEEIGVFSKLAESFPEDKNEFDKLKDKMSAISEKLLYLKNCDS